MKRSLVITEWEMEPFLLDIITPYIGETVMACRDFIEWHCTCKTVWRHFDSLMYGEYMHQFLLGCVKRNMRLYTKVPLMSTYSRIAELTTVIRVCQFLPFLVTVMKTKPIEFDYSPIMIVGDLSKHRCTGPNLSRVQDIDMINIMYHYIREKFGWSIIIYQNTTPKTQVKMPLTIKTSVYGPTHEYSMALAPGLTDKTMRSELSICHSK